MSKLQQLLLAEVLQQLNVVPVMNRHFSWTLSPQDGLNKLTHRLQTLLSTRNTN